MTEPFQPGQHLSPDQLSAFAENVLPEHERFAALTHLSACADCRQAVFIAQQADPALAASPVTETQRRGWFTLPQLFAAATAALACSLILALIVHLHPNQNPATPAVNTAQLQTPQPIAPQSSAQVTPKQESPQQLPTFAPHVSAPPSLPKPALVQMVPTPQSVGAIGVGMATGRTSEAKMAEPQAQDKLQTPNSTANSATSATLAPQKSPSGVAGAMQRAAPPPAPPAQLEARTRQAYAAAAAPASATSVEVTSMAETVDASSIENLPANGRNSTNYAALTPGVVRPLRLPSKKPVASMLNATASRTLALDTDGTLFLSNDHGKHWTAVATQWTGKAVQLNFAATPARLYLAQPTQNQAQSQVSSSTGGAAMAGIPQQQAPAPTAGFELTTATGAVWVSTDGLTWHAR